MRTLRRRMGEDRLIGLRRVFRLFSIPNLKNNNRAARGLSEI